MTALLRREISDLNINTGYSLTFFGHSERSRGDGAVIAQLALGDPHALVGHLLRLDACVPPDRGHEE